MAKSFEVTCPHCGETYLVEIPEPEKRRGQLYGISLADMTDDQLKREIINAGSVLYKAKQRGASEDVIARNQARLDAAKAEKAKRHPVVEAEEAATDTANVTPAEENVYDEAAAAELSASQRRRPDYSGRLVRIYKLYHPYAYRLPISSPICLACRFSLAGLASR